MVFGNITLQRLQPFQQGDVGLPGGLPRNPLVYASRKNAFFQCGLFGADGDFRISIRRLQVCMAEPSTNDVYLGSGFQEMHCGAMPPNVRRNEFPRAIGSPLNKLFGVTTDELVNAESG